MFESLVFHYCVFFRDNRMEYGWIEGIQKNKLIIVPLHGKKQFLAGNRIAFSWKDDKLPLNADAAHESIAEQTKKAEQFQRSCELETMHSLLDEIKEYSLEELAVDFLDDAEDTICKLGLFLALREDSFWFKHNRNLTYTPRTEEELELLKVQLARQKELKERELNIQTWIKNLESGDWDADSEISTEQRQWLHQLLNLLTEGTDSQYWKEMSSLLDWGSALGIGEKNALKRWLERAGSPVSTSRLTLLRASVREHFSNEIYQEVERVRNIPLEKQEMLSPEVPTFTVDAKKTRDYDDAFSVMEWSSGGLVIAVHITDLSDFVYPQDALFKEAEARISSVYSLEESIPMIPDELSSDTFSLKAGEDRKVLSFMFQLSANGTWNLLEVVPRVIRVQKNLSYEEADHLIEEKRDFWGLLNKFCQRSLEQRLENGALNLSRKEFDFNISDPKDIKITALNRNSAANRIIEELAISVNCETGRIFQEADFPGIYRTQSSYEIIKEVAEGTKLSMENIRIEPARLSTIPGKHAGLGCNVYMQATSPIRRFVDLVTQQNLKLLINQHEPVFSEEDMMRWSEEISLRQRKYSRAEREIIKFWKLKYLQQHLGDNFEAKVRKKLANNNTEIELLELDCVVSAAGLTELESGEHLLLRIDEVGLEPPRLVVKALSTGTDAVTHRLE
ncbi:MAG: RNB domain-containing ribonuclease [Deltaproteobacteria bacterium]|jgi:exoribonuclease II|nr:RNB domain-containing ribonuclease [Deltaproteobacteria bacterium]